MNGEQLWDYSLTKKIRLSRPVDRDFIWIKKKDFKDIQDHFVEETNLFHSGKSYRSMDLFSHIHAVEQGEHVFLHKDFGNLARFFPLGLLHLFFDVIPFLTIARLKGIPKNSLYRMPE